MKRIFFLLIAATGALSASAQTTPGAPEMPKKKVYTRDALLKRWVLDVNGMGGVLTQDMTTEATKANYLNAVNYDNGGNVKFDKGMSMGLDAQLGFFWGRKRHFGIGAGFMYLWQYGDLTASNPFHVEYQATDYQGNTYRSSITSNQAIKETLKITNMNIPIMLKYKNKFSKRFGFTADAGVLLNLKTESSYKSNATFDYEAIYQYVLKNDGKTVDHTTYDNSPVPSKGDVLYTKSEFVASPKYPTVESYFNTLKGTGYNVGLGVAPTKNNGTVSYATGSVGFLVRPAINYFVSDNFAITLGVYYMYQPFTNKVNTSYQLTNKVGEYSSVLNTVSTSNNQSYGANLGVRVFFGKGKDTDKDGVMDKDDKCPTVWGLRQFFGCPDTDGDGIVDNEDSCVSVAGTLKFNGCPDSDGDGITDKDDACPFQAGTAQFNGCPDRDGDGVIDKIDACPDKAGLAQYNGCPDTDGDGVPDNDDRCPNEAGPASNNGCPVPAPPPAPAPEGPKLSTPIQFEVNKTVVMRTSYPILEEAVRRLKEDKDAYIVVDGYTDITGKPAYNKTLSVKRAKAVKAELMRLGVKESKIRVVGNGSKSPAESNNTAEGRARNRRAVIHLNMVGE